MKGERYLIEQNGTLNLLGLQEYSRKINRGEQMKYLGKVKHMRAKIEEPLIKKRILELFEQNLEMIANKGKANCLENFKKLVYNKL